MYIKVSQNKFFPTLPSVLLTASHEVTGPTPAREEPQTGQQESGGSNEKNANLAVQILHLASLMRDQGDQGTGQL